jgi:glycosyltransferase involved in cell wall biosynthesis
LCFNSAAKIICVSMDLKEHLHSKWNIEESRLAVLPCAADVEAFAPNYDTTVVRQALGLTTEPVIMWVGGFYPWHDLDLLLESFAQVLPRHPATRLVLVGDGQTRPAITQKVRENGLEQAVIMTGTIPHTRVPAMVSIADVAVVPSVPVSAGRGGTGTPLKLFEYMAAGKAIVATALSQAAAVIEDGHTGLLVEAGDVNGFAEAMLVLLDDPVERSRLGQNAQQHAVAHHSWEQYTRQLEATYRDVLR